MSSQYRLRIPRSPPHPPPHPYLPPSPTQNNAYLESLAASLTTPNTVRPTAPRDDGDFEEHTGRENDLERLLNRLVRDADGGENEYGGSVEEEEGLEIDEEEGIGEEEVVYRSSRQRRSDTYVPQTSSHINTAESYLSSNNTLQSQTRTYTFSQSQLPPTRLPAFDPSPPHYPRKPTYLFDTGSNVAFTSHTSYTTNTGGWSAEIVDGRRSVFYRNTQKGRWSLGCHVFGQGRSERVN